MSSFLHFHVQTKWYEIHGHKARYIHERIYEKRDPRSYFSYNYRGPWFNTNWEPLHHMIIHWKQNITYLIKKHINTRLCHWNVQLFVHNLKRSIENDTNGCNLVRWSFMSSRYEWKENMFPNISGHLTVQ